MNELGRRHRSDWEFLGTGSGWDGYLLSTRHAGCGLRRSFLYICVHSFFGWLLQRALAPDNSSTLTSPACPLPQSEAKRQVTAWEGGKALNKTFTYLKFDLVGRWNLAGMLIANVAAECGARQARGHRVLPS